jgi:hypothetical protein
MIKSGAKEVTHLIQPEITVVENEEKALLPILQKVNTQQLAAKAASLLQEYSNGSITADEVALLEASGTKIITAVVSVIKKLIGFAS